MADVLWTADQIRQKVRMTILNLDWMNPDGFEGQPQLEGAHYALTELLAWINEEKAYYG